MKQTRSPRTPHSGRRTTLAVGLTGGIASGKSAVASVFRARGAMVIQADREAKAVLRDDPAVRKAVIRLLGAGAYTPSGRPDRKFIAGKIFSDAGLRRSVDAVIHPKVISGIRKTISREKKRGSVPIVVVEAALIYEADMARMFDVVIMVDAPLEVRIDRLRLRDGIPRSDALKRIRSQRSNRSKAAMADIIISNTGDRRALGRAGRFLFRLLAGPRRPGR